MSQWKRPPFSYDCSFYKCRPISIIFSTQYTELMCNIIAIYLPPYLLTVATLPWEISQVRVIHTDRQTDRHRAMAYTAQSIARTVKQVLLPTALMRQVMQSPPSVCLSVCPFVSILSSEPTVRWYWCIACEQILTISRRGLKFKVTGHGRGQRSTSIEGSFF